MLFDIHLNNRHFFFSYPISLNWVHSLGGVNFILANVNALLVKKLGPHPEFFPTPYQNFLVVVYYLSYFFFRSHETLNVFSRISFFPSWQIPSDIYPVAYHFSGSSCLISDVILWIMSSCPVGIVSFQCISVPSTSFGNYICCHCILPILKNIGLFSL